MNEQAEKRALENEWDSAWREGRARAIEDLTGIPYKEAALLARDHIQPHPTVLARLGGRLLARAMRQQFRAVNEPDAPNRNSVKP